MKYYTRGLIERFGSYDETVASAAQAEVEAVSARYEQHLQQIRPAFPPDLRRLVDEVLLHDADVLSIAHRTGLLFMGLRKDIPPRDVVLLTYTLTEEPWIDKSALAPEDCTPVMQFLYDEFDLIHTGSDVHYTQSILFSNGWEMRLRFSDVQMILAKPLYPPPGVNGIRWVSSPAGQTDVSSSQNRPG
jgi:hypothetical protein